jgi:hypothetical protein
MAVNLCTNSLNNGGKILIFGNGGSAADAQHLAAELVGRYKIERQGLAAIALTPDPSALTSIGNDYGYEFIFSRHLYRPTSSAAMCCASAALPPLPNIKILPPLLRLFVHKLTAISSWVLIALIVACVVFKCALNSDSITDCIINFLVGFFQWF